MKEVPNIPTFYKGQHVLVSGATGFIGKALVEKLLRCCSDVEKITVILRPKKGIEAKDRLKAYLDEAVFERVKREKPGVINKVDFVSGDLMVKGLHLSPEDRQMLEESVSIIFHSAASVRFDDPIKKALAVNTRATLEIVNMAKNMMNLKVLVYISTAYSNCDRYEIKEMFYPAPCNWKTILPALDLIDDNEFTILTSKILGEFPNTYTFTKALAEHVVKDAAKDLPVVICRPSIVSPAFREPFPGWLDNFNGPVGLMIAAGIGLISTIYGEPNSRLNFVAIDQLVNALLVSAWEKANLSKEHPPAIINAARNATSSIKGKELVSIGKEHFSSVPMGYSIWPATCTETSNFYMYYIKVLLFHFLLGSLLEPLVKCFQPKVSLISLYRKMHNASLSLQRFTLNEWEFGNERMHWLRTVIFPEDKELFDFERFEEPCNENHIKLYALGVRRFLFKMHDYTISDHKAFLRRLIWAVRAYYSLLCLCLCWIAYKMHLQYVNPALSRMYEDVKSIW